MIKHRSVIIFSLAFLLLAAVSQIMPFSSHAATSVAIHWQPPAAPVDGYRLYYKTGSSGPPYDGSGAIEGPSPVDAGNATTAILSGLSETETYYLTITSYIGNVESDYAEEFTFRSTATPNTPPTARNGSISTRQNTPASGRLAAFDKDRDPLVFSIVTNGNLGRAVITDQATGAFTYTPLTGSAGNDAFTFKVNDGTEDSNTATMRVSIKAGNNIPPTAVISSSAGVGEPPLLVQFDGSSSSDSDGSITSYDWDFGDGGTAAGVNVAHTYNDSGSYTARLTVTDNSNGTDSASTPILVSVPDNNTPPQAVITSSRTQGSAPLNVTIDGSRSHDPDGTIVDYTWIFADGSTLSGSSVSHVFNQAGVHTVVLEVKDNKDAVGRTSIDISVHPPQEIAIEYGSITITHDWRHVTLQQQFTRPVVVAGPLSASDDDPAVVRVRNVTPEGFDIRLQEWDYLDGWHADEQVDYLVMEEGSYVLDDGSKIEAGNFTAGRYKSQQFMQPFQETPVVFTTITSVHDENCVIGRLRSLSPSDFVFMMLEQEANGRGRHRDETVSYIAVEMGRGTIGLLRYEAGKEALSDRVHQLRFQAPFADTPLFLAGIQSLESWDTAAIRYDALSPSGAALFIEEETSKDSETTHPAESVGYMVLLPEVP